MRQPEPTLASWPTCNPSPGTSTSRVAPGTSATKPRDGLRRIGGGVSDESHLVRVRSRVRVRVKTRAGVRFRVPG